MIEGSVSIPYLWPVLGICDILVRIRSQIPDPYLWLMYLDPGSVSQRYGWIRGFGSVPKCQCGGSGMFIPDPKHCKMLLEHPLFLQNKFLVLLPSTVQLFQFLHNQCLPPALSSSRSTGCCACSRKHLCEIKTNNRRVLSCCLQRRVLHDKHSGSEITCPG